MMNMGLRRTILRGTVSSSMRMTSTQMIYSGCSLEEDYLKIGREGLCIEGNMGIRHSITSIIGDIHIMMRMEERSPRIQDWLYLLSSLLYCSCWL